MNELAAPLTQVARAQARFERLLGLHAQKTRLELQIRQETAALVEQDTAFGQRPFVADELALALAESTGTCRRWIDDARLLLAHPRLLALVADQTWSIRHADAVLDELTGAAEPAQQQILDRVLSDPAARTPYQLRKATRAARLLHELEHDQH